MNDTSKRVDPVLLVGGALLIAFGAVLLVGQFHGLHFGRLIRTYWPMIVVAVGLPKLFDFRTLWNGLWLMAVGCWLQLVTLHLYGLTYGNSWPLLLMVLGGGIVLRTLLESFTGGDATAEHEDHHGS